MNFSEEDNLIDASQEFGPVKYAIRTSELSEDPNSKYFLSLAESLHRAGKDSEALINVISAIREDCHNLLALKLLMDLNKKISFNLEVKKYLFELLETGVLPERGFLATFCILAASHKEALFSVSQIYGDKYTITLEAGPEPVYFSTSGLKGVYEIFDVVYFDEQPEWR